MTEPLKIHVEIYLAAQMLKRKQGTFSSGELVGRIQQKFGDTRPGVQTHATSHCVANKPLHTAYANNYLWQLGRGQYRCFDPARDTPHPDRLGGRDRPPLEDVPSEYHHLLPAEDEADTRFEAVDTFSWQINRAERSQQVRLLAPLLHEPWGRIWFLEKLECPCAGEEAYAAQVFHLCFPLRDTFTADYYQCRGKPHLEDQFIAYYNRLFELPEGFGVQEVWRTAPGNEIRHPAAGGRAGWYVDFLKERIRDSDLRERARNVRRILGTEADLLLLTQRFVVLVECKYLSPLSMEQYERQQMMGETLARRLGKAFHFGLVVEGKRDTKYAQIDAPYVLWSEIWDRLIGHV
jgi:hypothetical protein